MTIHYQNEFEVDTKSSLIFRNDAGHLLYMLIVLSREKVVDLFDC